MGAALANVMTEPGASELREFGLPRVADDAGLLQVEAAGVCGSDVGAYGRPGPERILGHENVGRIVELGPLAAERWGVAKGERVALEEYLPCGHCALCRTSEFRLCKATDSRGGGIRYGTTGIEVEPSLWGGYSQYQYLHPNSVIHRVPEGVPAERLALALPVANGYQWACLEGGAGPGQSVLVIGPGQQGLACALAAKSAGAAQVIVTGLGRDRKRLEVAKALGADLVVDVESTDPEDAMREFIGGRPIDLVIDTALGDSPTLNLATALLAQNGTIVLPTAKDRVNDLALKALQWKCGTLRGVRGHSYASVEWAIETIAAGQVPLELLCTHRFGLEEVDEAIRATGGERGDDVVHVTVDPWLSST